MAFRISLFDDREAVTRPQSPLDMQDSMLLQRSGNGFADLSGTAAGKVQGWDLPSNSFGASGSANSQGMCGNQNFGSSLGEVDATGGTRGHDPFGFDFKLGFTEDESWQLRNGTPPQQAPSSPQFVDSPDDRPASASCLFTSHDESWLLRGGTQPLPVPSSPEFVAPSEEIVAVVATEEGIGGGPDPDADVIINDTPTGSQIEKEFSRAEANDKRARALPEATPKATPPMPLFAESASTVLGLPRADSLPDGAQVISGTWDVLLSPNIRRNEAVSADRVGTQCSSRRGFKRMSGSAEVQEAPRSLLKNVRATALELMRASSESSEWQPSTAY